MNPQTIRLDLAGSSSAPISTNSDDDAPSPTCRERAKSPRIDGGFSQHLLIVELRRTAPWLKSKEGDFCVLTDDGGKFYVKRTLLQDSVILSGMLSGDHIGTGSDFRIADATSATLTLWFGLESGLLSAVQVPYSLSHQELCTAFVFAHKYECVRFKSQLAPWLDRAVRKRQGNPIHSFLAATAINSVGAAARVLESYLDVLNPPDGRSPPKSRVLDPNAMPQETLQMIPHDYLFALLRTRPTTAGKLDSKEKHKVAREFERIMVEQRSEWEVDTCSFSRMAWNWLDRADFDM